MSFLEQLKSLNLTSSDIIWYVYSQTSNFIHDILSRYRYVIHYFEYAPQNDSWKFRLLILLQSIGICEESNWNSTL